LATVNSDTLFIWSELTLHCSSAREDSLSSAQRHVIFGYPKQTATVGRHAKDTEQINRPFICIVELLSDKFEEMRNIGGMAALGSRKWDKV
jgi:phosphoserine aminotransferase